MTMTIEEIQQAIIDLPGEEYSKLRKWLADRDWEAWDKEIEADSESGKLDFLLAEAEEDEDLGTLQDL